MTGELLERAGVSSMLKPEYRVTIKPNLVVGNPADGGATTHPQIVDGIILFLQKHGIRDITIAEGSWVGADTRRAFETCGYAELAKRRGVKLIDTKRDKVVTVKSAYAGDIKICESAVNSDFLINVPVLKGHCQTGMTCCLKNLKGLIPDGEKRRYHSEGLSKPIAALGAAVKPNLHVVDGICGDLDFEEGGNPVVANRIILGFDPVQLDSYCAPLMGYRPDEIAYLRLAKEFGAGEYYKSIDRVVELNADNKPPAKNARGAGARRYAHMIDEDGACSACYAALVFALRQGGGFRGKIKVGQGFAGKKPCGIGSGNCASGCDAYVKGCPPSALDISEFLKQRA